MAISVNRKRLQVTLGKQTFEKLERCSEWSGLSKSQIIESALIDYLAEKGFYDDEERVMFL